MEAHPISSSDSEFISDVLDADLVPQVYTLDCVDQPWRPLLRDDQVEYPDDPFDIL